ncbi:MAG: anti-sigma factor [Saprospiraceae bacterium]|nr:anti-sigma factor [Saprospiraceae bacterium]
MDIKAYIASGILEQYVIGALSDREMAEVELMMQQHEEVKKEIEAIEAGYESLSRAFAQKTPIKEDEVVRYVREKATLKMNPPSSGLSKWWPILPILGLGILSATFYISLDQSKKDLVKSQEKYATLSQNCEEISRENTILKERLLFVTSPESRVVILKGTALSKDAFATVVVNEEQQKIYLASNGLPAPPTGKQYQLWALKDGTPIDMGVFDVSGENLIEKSGIPGAQAYAITLENSGGSPTPTLEQMYVTGS